MNKLQMKAINRYIQELAPTNPFDIVVQNKFYPQGLRSIDVYEYYMRNQIKILKWINSRKIVLRISINPDTNIIRRNINGSPIILNSKNFSTILTGQTNMIYIEHPLMINYFIININIGPNTNSKNAIAGLDFLMKEYGGKSEILTLSATKLCYIGYVNKPQNINRLREKIRLLLETKIEPLNTLSRNIKFHINIKKPKANAINFDLSSMYHKSFHPVRFSLTKEFLICDIPEKGLKRIKKSRS